MKTDNDGGGLFHAIMIFILGFTLGYTIQNYRIVKVGENRPAAIQPSDPHKFNQASTLNRGPYNR